MERSIGRRALLATLAVALLAAVWAQSASAVIVRLQGGKTLSYQPLRGASTISSFDEFFSNLDYNGGPIMPSNTNYALYWQPSGAPAYPADYQPGVDRYFEDLAHDSGGVENVESVSTQYNDAAGQFANYSSSFAGALIDTDPYPANGCAQAPICLTDAQLQEELRKFVAAHELPTDLTHEYFLLTPPGVEDCFQASGRECSAGSSKPVYCAYHSNVPLGGGGEIIYANDPYVTGNAGCDDGNHPNGSSSDGILQGGLSHEHNESITDPEPNNAWTDIGGSGGENGDKCRVFEEGKEFGTPLGTHNGAKYNQVINGDFYWYQQEWSNQTHQCLQRLSFSGEEPTATFTSAAGAGNEMSFDATGSSAPGGVARYNWQFNDGPGLSTPVESTTPTVSHTFPLGGKYLVALTVFAGNGTSIGTARSVSVGKPPTPAVTKVAPAKGPAAGGTTVTITGKNLAEVSAVSFGSRPAASFTVKSASTITALSPGDAAETVDVTVTSPGGTSATSLADHFKFGPPTVSEIAPNNGPTAGGTSLTVTGTGFALGTTATAFKFGTLPAASASCSSFTTCTVIAPARKAGAVDLRATVSKATSQKTAADLYTYH
jgi:hypothetical protein